LEHDDEFRNVELDVELELVEHSVIRFPHRIYSHRRLAVWRHEDAVVGIKR